jgi:RHS repeat-associated protein
MIGTGTGDAGDKYIGLDRFGRVVDLRWKTSSSDHDRFKYGYDRDSNRLYRTNELSHSFDELYHANGASNGYDGLNPLSDFRRGTLSDTNSDNIPDTVSTAVRTQTWDPDGLGNFEGVNTDGTNQTRTHNKQNQSTVVGGNNLVFDNNGNMTTDETGRTITYDAWNRLVKINGVVRYGSDALGRRIKEGSNDLYYSPSWQVVEERDSSGNAVDRYVWSPVYVDAMVLRDRNADGNRNNGLEERLYVAQDANFNVTALINTSGSVVERTVYDPYGRFDVKDASWVARSATLYDWKHYHQGLRLDGTGTLYDNRMRMYSPTLMRFMQNDPIGFGAGDQNTYRYVGDGPTGLIDPDGLTVHTAPVVSAGDIPAGRRPGSQDWRQSPLVTDAGGGLIGDIAAGLPDCPAQRARERMVWKLAEEIMKTEEFQRATGILPAGVTSWGTAVLWARRRLTPHHVDYPPDEVRVHGSPNPPEPDWFLRWFGPQEMGYGYAWDLLMAVGSIAGAIAVRRQYVPTGRFWPQNLQEQLALQEAQSRPRSGRPIDVVMTDPQWPAADGWVKMVINIAGIEIHYVRNTKTGRTADWKFK